MHRFFIPAEWIDGKMVVVRGRQVHQLRDVLRLNAGDSIAVLDNTGREYQVELETVARGCARGVVTAELTVAEPRTAITLYQALLKAGRFELILQKCTELGVARFVPMLCQRCVVRGPEAASGRKVERWRRIIVEAAEQSGRGRLPVLEPAVTFEEACRAAAGFSLLPWEGEKALGLRAALRGEIDRQAVAGGRTPRGESSTAGQQPFVVSQRPFVVSEEPFVVSEEPLVVSQERFAVSQEPFVVSEEPFVVSLSNHERPVEGPVPSGAGGPVPSEAEAASTTLRQAQGERGWGRGVHRGAPTEALLSVNLFIGPEGGFASSEVEFARSCGIVPVTLGSRVLRAETAGLVAASAILYECGDLDPPASG